MSSAISNQKTFDELLEEIKILRTSIEANAELFLKALADIEDAIRKGKKKK